MIDEMEFIANIEKRYCEPCKKEGRYWGENKCLICWVDDMMNEIEMTPKVGEWIPCSERLPEMSGSYLCCWKKDDDPRITMSVLNFDGEGFPWERLNYYYSKVRVIAWMPLPEPYREDGEQNG